MLEKKDSACHDILYQGKKYHYFTSGNTMLDFLKNLIQTKQLKRFLLNVLFIFIVMEQYSTINHQLIFIDFFLKKKRAKKK